MILSQFYYGQYSVPIKDITLSFLYKVSLDVSALNLLE